MSGRCAKKHVECIIVSQSGVQYKGTNACNNPQEVCPRLPGEGFDKCKLICDQPVHAEIMALREADKYADGATAYLIGISHFCRTCQEALQAAGITTLVFGAPPR